VNNPIANPILTGFGLLCLAGAALADSVDETRPAEPDARIELIGVSGDFEILGHEADELVVSGRLGDDVRELIIDGDPSAWRVELKMKEGRRGWSPGAGDSSDLRLLVPHGGRVDARTVSADLVLDGLDGEAVDVQTVSGDLALGRVTPVRLRAETVSGDLSAVGGGSRDNRIQSVSGDVELREAGGRHEIESVSGDIEFDGLAVAELRVQSVSGDVDARVRPAPGALIELESHSGDVALHLPANSGLRLDAETFSGSIESDFGGTVRRGRGPGEKLRLETGDAGIRVEANTFSGRFRLRELD